MKKNTKSQESNPLSLIPKTSESLITSPKYEEFIKSVRLINMGLMHINSALDRSVYGDLSPRSRTVNMSAKYAATHVGKDFFDAIGIFAVKVDDGKKRKGDDAEPPLHIECAFEAHFHAKVTSKQFVEAFAEGELRLVLWPYFRQLVNDLTGRMAITPLVIPFSTRYDESKD